MRIVYTCPALASSVLSWSSPSPARASTSCTRPMPGAFVMRRPDPQGSGAPCRATLRWARAMLDECLAAFRHRGLELPPPIVAGDRWFGDSRLMTDVSQQPQGSLLVERKTTYRFPEAMGATCKALTCSRGVARARAPLRTQSALGVVAGDEPHLRSCDERVRGGIWPGSLLSPACRDDGERSAADASVAEATGSSLSFGC
jgi:hypothetical protein